MKSTSCKHLDQPIIESIAVMTPDALITAQNWGLGDYYTEEKITEMFELTV